MILKLELDKEEPMKDKSWADRVAASMHKRLQDLERLWVAYNATGPEGCRGGLTY